VEKLSPEWLSFQKAFAGFTLGDVYANRDDRSWQDGVEHGTATHTQGSQLRGVQPVTTTGK
jgi:hypothetical protein